MVEKLKENWFIVLIAIVMISFVGYFTYDSTKYNVSSKKVDGKEVLATVADKDVTADDLYNESKAFDSALIYNIYRNAVVEQTVKTTDDLKDEAKKLENAIRSNANSADNFEESITAELASYGYKSYDDLDDYCMMSVKEKEMNNKYVDKHFDELSDAVNKKQPRTISILSMAVADPASLSKEEQKKKDSIDKAIENEGFASAAKSFSEDPATSNNKGVYGFITSDDAASQNTPLDPTIINSALALDKGKTSDWITVQDKNSGSIMLYKVHVDNTDLNEIHKTKNKDIKDQVLYAFLNSNQGLRTTILENNAKKLDIKISDKETKQKLDAYIKQQKGENK